MGEYKSFNKFLEKNTHLTAKSLRSYNRKSRTFLVELKLFFLFFLFLCDLHHKKTPVTHFTRL